MNTSDISLEDKITITQRNIQRQRTNLYDLEQQERIAKRIGETEQLKAIATAIIKTEDAGKFLLEELDSLLKEKEKEDVQTTS
jgi:hypothetical protein